MTVDVDSEASRNNVLAFIPDPENRRKVFDPDSGYELRGIFGSVPKNEFWFDFCFDDITFMVKSKLSWSTDRLRLTFTFNVAQLYHSYRYSPRRGRGQETMCLADFRAQALPHLRNAVVAFATRARGDPRLPGERLKAEVEFADPAPEDCGGQMR
ncbi:hypothetical protein [Bradyrhizobium sp. HKCCYLRH3061]|uniref:hypothetical protein n=1 Tax=Bradyrhizobium sp. HKCCYLRH3061 TaxID=3420734 RepID=UPI003EB83794